MLYTPKSKRYRPYWELLQLQQLLLVLQLPHRLRGLVLRPSSRLRLRPKPLRPLRQVVSSK
jgi:hypothetical protein